MSKPKSKAPSVKSFMSQILFTFEETTSLQEAAQLLSAQKLTTVPVLSQNGSILGVISDFQLVRLLLRYQQSDKKTITLGDVKSELDPVTTIHEDESIVAAFQLMVQSPNHRIYTVLEDKLTGALSPKDMLLYMAGVKDQSEQALNEVVQKQVETILKELNETRKALTGYQQMFHDSPYLMHSVDMSGKITAANAMIHCVLGYEDGELVGKSLRQLYPPENYRKAMQGLETIKNVGFHPIVNVTMVKKDGSPIRIDVASTLRKDAKGNPEGTITVGRLSDSYRMVNYLQKANRLYTRRSRPKAG